MEFPLEEGSPALFKSEERNEVNAEKGLLSQMARFRKNPFNFAHELSLFIRGVDWRGYDNIIGQPCFYDGYTQDIKKAVLQSKLLNDRIRELTENCLKDEEAKGLLNPQDRGQRKAQIISQLADKTHQTIDDMMCKMESKTYIRSAYYGCTQLLTRAYSGIHVNNDEVERLRHVARIAAEKNQPIIFLPRHSSHIDYVTLQLICYRLGITLPVVVAGDNLNFRVVGSFLQSCGAMWIQRNFDRSTLYGTTVQAYLDTLMQKGYNLECFIEGTRSRTGKLLGPKTGILAYYLDSVLSRRTEDAYICPVSLQYDKVIEVDSYVTELLGKPKEKENLMDFLSASSILSLNHGRIDCRFHEPWSLRAFIDEQQLRQDSTGHINYYSSAPNSAPRDRLVRTLGYRVLSDINAVSVAMPSALVGTVLLTLRGRGVGKSELVRRVNWLCDRIRANGGRVADFHSMTTEAVVSKALEVLGPKLVGTIDNLAETTYYALDRFQLSFYRNMIIHLFISEAIVCVALYTKIKQGGTAQTQRLPEEELAKNVEFLSRFFRSEFIFPAGQGLEYNLRSALDKLISHNVLAATVEDGVRYIGLSEAERAQGRESYDFYCFLLWPFVDAAWLAATSLHCIVPPLGSKIEWIDMKTAQDGAQLFGRTLYHQGDLSYFESINKEALKNAFSKFQEEGIILVRKLSEQERKDKVPQKVRISPDWLPARDMEGVVKSEGKLWDFIANIGQYRREGKNRRDGNTVERRVLGLAAKLNKEAFEQFERELAGQMKGDGEGKETMRGRRRRTKL
jgi:glycerol-3-phosphate O-acyltransferase